MFTFADQVEAMNEALSEERAEGVKQGEKQGESMLSETIAEKFSLAGDCTVIDVVYLETADRASILSCLEKVASDGIDVRSEATFSRLTGDIQK